MSHGFELLKSAGKGRAVVVLHGLGQKRDHLKKMAQSIANCSVGIDVYIYGYDHTLSLVTNGLELANALDQQIPKGRIDLVGYSMGGLVARLAASDRHPSRIHTVVTLATPNRGSMSNSELTALGQLTRNVLFISPFAPQSDGIQDLTKAAEIMALRRERMLREDAAFRCDASQRRYVSIPALFYHVGRSAFDSAPSFKIKALNGAIAAISLRLRLISMPRANDGIVTEKSNDITITESHDWAETRLFDAGPNDHPARCHVVVDTCVKQDHISIIEDAMVGETIAALLSCDDWRNLKAQFPHLSHRVGIKPIDPP